LKVGAGRRYTPPSHFIEPATGDIFIAQGSLPEGLVADAAWLENHGYSRSAMQVGPRKDAVNALWEKRFYTPNWRR
jgi:hypothetical protein